MRLTVLDKHLPVNWQKYLNFYIFINFAGYAAWHLKTAYSSGGLLITDITFTMQSVLLCIVILIRSDHKAIEPGFWRQVVAMAAFFSGLLMLENGHTSSQAALKISQYIILSANFLGLLTILNLGKSFGILIAVREIKTSGLYGFVRHPMYATDILLRFGYLVGHPTVTASAVVAFSVLAYYWRARFEEEFLSLDASYKEYMKRVRYRFVPFLF